MPRVTVVVPAHNAAATVRATLDSVLAQAARDLEVIVVDDGSTDDTAAIVAAYGDPIRCVHQANAGVSAARNTGIEHAGGELVAFLDADDLWEPQKLEAQLAALDATPEAGVAYVGVTRIDAGERAIGTIPAVAYDDPTEALLLRSSIVSGSCSSGIVRRSVLDDFRFDARFSQCADWHLWLRLSLRTAFAAIDRPLIRYRSSAGNMSSDISLLERDTFAVLDAFYEEEPDAARYLAIRRHVYSNHWMIVGGSHLHAGAPLDASRCVARGLALHPANIGRVFGLPLRTVRRLASRRRAG